MSKPEPPQQPRTTAKTAPGRAERAERLAREMRANLTKRKQRQRALDQERGGPRGEEPPET